MRRNKASFAVSVMTTIMMSASLFPAQIHAEEEISEEPELIVETVPEDEFVEETEQAETLYHINLMNDDEFVDIKTTVCGVETLEAHAGDEVSIEVTTAECYLIKAVYGVSEDATTTVFFGESEANFLMPEYNVNVFVVIFENLRSATIDNTMAKHTDVRLLNDSGEESTKFIPGKCVHAVPKCLAGKDSLYRELKARTVSGSVLDARYSGDEMYFTMPDEDVVISAFEGIQYVDENGTSHACGDYKLLSSAVDQIGVTLTDGWYVAEGAGWGFNNRVTILGDVNIILTDNCHLILNRGILNDERGHLSIWGQTAGSGRMDCVQAFEAALSGGNAGIGGDKGSSAGTFNLHGGTVIAKGEKDGAGVGGGKSGNGGTINIYGGTLEATGGTMAAGIGGGSEGSSGSINIYGGVVRAVGGEAGRGSDIGGGAGIGGGDEANANSVIISGGQISAKGNGGGAGIGGGNEGSGNSISISGGVIDAHGGYYDSDMVCSFEVFSGAGIGGGDDGNSGDIIITGGNIFAESTFVDTMFDDIWGAGIGAGDDGDVNNIQILGGTVEGHGYRAVGCGEDGKDGSILLGDNIDIVGFEWNDRYSVLSYGHDLLLRAR